MCKLGLVVMVVAAEAAVVAAKADARERWRVQPRWLAGPWRRSLSLHSESAVHCRHRPLRQTSCAPQSRSAYSALQFLPARWSQQPADEWLAQLLLLPCGLAATAAALSTARRDEGITMHGPQRPITIDATQNLPIFCKITTNTRGPSLLFADWCVSLIFGKVSK